jgi:RNA polymerase sigma-70 factor, ECF subfamily
MIADQNNTVDRIQDDQGQSRKPTAPDMGNRMMDQSRTMELFLASVEKQAYQMAVIAVRSADEALDLVQEAMLGLVRHYSARSEAEWRPLFFRILQSRIRDWYRRDQVRQRWHGWLGRWHDKDEEDDDDPFDEVAAPELYNPARQVEGRAAMTALVGALRELPLRQQQTFLLRAWQGLSVEETAVAMQCSDGSVKTHYSRAVHTLREMLEGHWP